MLQNKKNKKNKYITGMVRVEVGLKKKLRLESFKRGITMSRLLDELIKKSL